MNILRKDLSRIDEFRIFSKPMEELERKARKACRKSNMWTREEIDWAIRMGDYLGDIFKDL